MVLDLADSKIQKTDNKQTNEGIHIARHCKYGVCVVLGTQRQGKI